MSRLNQAFAFSISMFFGSVTQAQVTLLTEDFDAGSPPTGWSRSQNTPSVGWEFGTDLGSQYFPIAAHGRYAASNDDAHDDSTHTGAGFGFCPDGYVKLEEALGVYGNLNGVSIHASDGMTIPDTYELDYLNIPGYPTGFIDIYRFPQEPVVSLARTVWNQRAGERLRQIAPVAASLENISYDPVTRTIDATVRAEFFGHVQGDLRFNVWIVEDGVTGSGSGFDQVNLYDSTPGHPYYGAGNPIIGFEHDRTLRAMLGGTWGTPGGIPVQVSDGEVYTHNYTFVLPAEFDETRISLIGLVGTYDPGDLENRAILNSDQESLWGIFDDGFEWGDSSAWSSVLP